MHSAHYYCKDASCHTVLFINTSIAKMKRQCPLKTLLLQGCKHTVRYKNTASSSCADAKMQACTLHLMLHHTIDGIHHRQCFYWFLPLFISPVQFIMICYWFVFACALCICICMYMCMCICTGCTVQVLVAELDNCAVCIFN